MKNRISIAITEEQLLDIVADVTALRDKITNIFPVTLTQNERDNLFRLADKRLAFDQKADDFLHQRPELRPPTIDLAEYDKDGTVVRMADRLLAAIETLTTPVKDTRAQAGNDRLDDDLAFLHFLEYSARIGTPGAEEVRAALSASYPAGRRAKSQGTPV